MPTNTLDPLPVFPTVTPRLTYDLRDANLNVHEDVEPARDTRSERGEFVSVVMFYIFCGYTKRCGDDVGVYLMEKKIIRPLRRRRSFVRMKKKKQKNNNKKNMSWQELQETSPKIIKRE
uniref:Uncharacterized protein n=1 Tax=Cacopsylla melanoneura TaxID=428564 RepID=A0A8D8M4C9_9HEMI